eukprot:7022860-Pyramimonas_sp.AAC.1
MSRLGGLARIHVLETTHTPKDGSHVNGGRQLHQSMLPDVGGQLLACNDPRRRTGERSAFGQGNPIYRDAQG